MVPTATNLSNLSAWSITRTWNNSTRSSSTCSQCSPSASTTRTYYTCSTGYTISFFSITVSFSGTFYSDSFFFMVCVSNSWKQTLEWFVRFDLTRSDCSIGPFRFSPWIQTISLDNPKILVFRLTDSRRTSRTISILKLSIIIRICMWRAQRRWFESLIHWFKSIVINWLVWTSRVEWMCH